MLVLFREDNLPPMSWRLAIISEAFPGSDRHVSVVTVKTSSGHLLYYNMFPSTQLTLKV